MHAKHTTAPYSVRWRNYKAACDPEKGIRRTNTHDGYLSRQTYPVLYLQLSYYSIVKDFLQQAQCDVSSLKSTIAWEVQAVSIPSTSCTDVRHAHSFRSFAAVADIWPIHAFCSNIVHMSKYAASSSPVTNTEQGKCLGNVAMFQRAGLRRYLSAMY